MTYSQGFLPSDLLISPTQLAQTLGKRIDDFWSVDPTGCSAAVGAPTVLFCVNFVSRNVGTVGMAGNIGFCNV